MSNNISSARNFKYKSLVTAILLYSLETWTLLPDWKKKRSRLQNQVHEETFPYLLLGAHDHGVGTEQDQLPCGSTGTSSGSCQQTETGMFSHVTWYNSLYKTILQGTLEGGRHCGQQRKCWMEWTMSKSGHLFPLLFYCSARKRPWPFCQKCRWQVIPKHAYTFDPTKLEWVHWATVDQSWCKKWN